MYREESVPHNVSWSLCPTGNLTCRRDSVQRLCAQGEAGLVLEVLCDGRSLGTVRSKLLGKQSLPGAAVVAEPGYSTELGGKDLLFFLDGQLLLLFGSVISTMFQSFSLYLIVFSVLPSTVMQTDQDG